MLSFGSRAAAEADGSNGPTVIFVNSALADDIRCGPSFMHHKFAK